MSEKCKVCGKTYFDSVYDICPVCGWWNDLVYSKNSGKWISWANAVDLEESRKLYNAGRIDKIVQRVPFDEKYLHFDESDGIKRAMYGMTWAEREYMYKIVEENFFRDEYLDEELKDVYNKIKYYHEDDAENDKIRNSIIERFENYVER